MKAAWLVALLWTVPAMAQDEVRIQFVPPPMEGTISLGVYDSAGKLVRTLRSEATAADFAVGLNGLIVPWDGRDDAGEMVKPGVFTAQGLVVGDLGIEGEAFLGNDWIDDETSPRLKRILHLQAHEGGALLMLAENADGHPALVRTNADGMVVWHQLLPEAVNEGLFAANADAQFVVTDGRIARLNLENGKADQWETGIVTRLAASDDRVVAVEDGRLRVRDAKTGVLQREVETGGELAGVAIHGDTVAAIRDGKLVANDGDGWREIPAESLQNAVNVSFSAAGTLWVVDRTADAAEVKEYGLDGAFLRRLGYAQGGALPSAVSAAGAGDTLFLLEDGEGFQRVRGLRRVASHKEEGPGAESVSTWQIVFSRAIRSSDAGEDAAGLLEGFEPQKTVTIELRPNPLSPDFEETIELAAGVSGAHSVLAVSDGLPLRTIAETPRLRWAVIGHVKDGAPLTVLQGDGAVTEQYSIAQPENMMSFTCGEFDFPPKTPAAVEPAVDE